MTRRAAGLIVALALVGCGDHPIGPGGSASELRGAPVTVDVDGRSLSLETHLWRDFMPLAPPNGHPLVAILRVMPSAGGLPDGLNATAVWIIFGEQMWATEALEVTMPESAPPPYLEVVARNGPLWGPHVKVDVVVRLRDSSGGTYLLRAPDQLIGRTD